MSCSFDLQGLGEAGIAQALKATDCGVNLAIAQSYGRLFGQAGVFAPVLTALLTVYVAFLAYGFLTGRASLSLAGLAPKAATIGLVLTFATSWPAYEALVANLLIAGPEQIASSLAGGHGHASLAFAARLDALFDKFADVAKALGADKTAASGPLSSQIAATLVWISALVLLVGTAGALVLTRIVLALLLALGPIFVVLALFESSRGLFEGWLKTCCLFAFAPMLTVLAGSGALALLSPLVDSIADNPAEAVSDVRPIIELFLGAVVYAGLMAMLLWTAAGLVAGWRPLSGARRPVSTPGATPSNPASSAVRLPGATAQAAHGSRASDERIGGVVSALVREPASAAAAATTVRVNALAAGTSAPRAGDGAGADGKHRARGLGQTFRPKNVNTHIAGVLGS
jgi:type IV secretion system protein VirB6